MLQCKKKRMLVVMLGFALTTSLVTVQAAEMPNAGTALESTRRAETAPAPVPDKTPIKVEEPLRPPLVGSTIKIPVSRFHITGQDLFPEEELLALMADATGKELTLTEIELRARAITKFFRERGYMMAGVYVPAQQIKDGVVELTVVVGRYDQIILNKKTVINDAELQLQLGGVKSGAYIKKDTLERAIWLLNDLAGVEAKATLAPGGKPGTANLILDIVPKGKPVFGDIGIDNYGNRFTGKNELFTDIVVNNMNHKGDQLAINGITTGSGLSSGSIAYQQPMFAPGGKLQVGYSRLHYALGEEYASADASGVADTADVTYRYAFHRSREANLYGQVGFAWKSLTDQLATVSTDKSSTAMVIGLNGDSFDEWGGGGNNYYSLTYRYGRLNYDGPAVLADPSTIGHFGKWNMTASRHQYINDHLTFALFMSAQATADNLDSSEKMSLGGAYGVRAYPQGEASSDEAFLLNTELRWKVPMKEKEAELLNLVAFFDYGEATLYKNPGPGTVDNHRTLMGAGLGAVWNNPGVMTIKAYYAWKVGSYESTSDYDKSGRYWLQMTSYF